MMMLITVLEVLIVMILSLCLHFNGHFPGGPGLAGTRVSPFQYTSEKIWTFIVLKDFLKHTFSLAYNVH